MTEFSLPQINKPIPSATVKVYFTLSANEADPKGVDMTFRFESDSLIHRPDRTIRISQMEVIYKRKETIRGKIFVVRNGSKRFLTRSCAQARFYSWELNLNLLVFNM